jgi:hypothetical protein
MGKMKREYESLVERGVILGNDMEDNVQRRYTTTPTKFNDPYNLWDTDDRGDNRVDFERMWDKL